MASQILQYVQILAERGKGGELGVALYAAIFLRKNKFVIDSNIGYVVIVSSLGTVHIHASGKGPIPAVKPINIQPQYEKDIRTRCSLRRFRA